MPRFAIASFAALLLSVYAPAQAAPPAEMPLKPAFDYAFPLQEMAKLRLARLGDGQTPTEFRLNQWIHMRALLGPADRRVTAPNNDTLYSLAWLDLANGPVRLSLPDTQGRYYSVAVLDMYTNNVAVLGRRTGGTRAREVLLVGPRWQGPLPEGQQVVQSTTNDVLLLSRMLVDGPADLPAVHALQDQLKLAPLAQAPTQPLWISAPLVPASDTSPMAAARRYLEMVNEMLARNPPPAYEQAKLDAWAAIGVCGARCRWNQLSPEVQQRWATELPGLLAELKRNASLGKPQPGGWTKPLDTLGDFGTDYRYRADVALTGLLALIPPEDSNATVKVDGRGEPLSGQHRYRLSLPAGGMPVDGFWSLSMYQEEPDGRLFFTDNPLKRYTLGDRTPGLKRGVDGSVVIEVGNSQPTDAAANWLPAPTGPFMLVMRAYQPRAEVLDGRFQMPAVQRLD